MDFFRTVMFAILNFVLLANAFVIKQRRFDSNHAPGFGKRAYIYEPRSFEGNDKDKRLSAAPHELNMNMPYWDTKPYTIPDWSAQEYHFPSYKSLSQRKLESAQDFVDPVKGYIRRYPNYVLYGTGKQESPFLEDEHSFIEPNGGLVSSDHSGTYNKVDNGLEESMSGGPDRQIPAGDRTMELAQLLKKLLSQRDQENSFPAWD